MTTPTAPRSTELLNHDLRVALSEAEDKVAMAPTAAVRAAFETQRDTLTKMLGRVPGTAPAAPVAEAPVGAVPPAPEPSWEDILAEAPQAAGRIPV